MPQTRNYTSVHHCGQHKTETTEAYVYLQRCYPANLIEACVYSFSYLHFFLFIYICCYVRCMIANYNANYIIVSSDSK